MEEDFIEDCYVETDEEYEFDASQFFDFTRPEIDSEIEEVERWFEVSGDYPHSPFVVKLNLEKVLSVEVVPNSSAKGSKKNKSTSSSSDTDSRQGVSKKNAKGKGYPMPQDNAKAKTKPDDKSSQSRSSTFMEPTASHLAKQHKVHEKHSSHLCTRFQRTSAKLDQNNTSSGSDNLATKRQKLDMGYLKKVSHLKHQFLLCHKSSKKVTVPREPELETELRAQRQRSKNSSASSETEKQKQNGCNFKAHPLNKKILQARPLSQPKKSKPQSPDFQVFHFKTGERANRHSCAKESRLSAGDKLPECPPTEQLAELSLGSNMETNKASQVKRHSSSKGLNKDGHDSFQAEFWRCHPKPNQCGGQMRVREASMTRSLDIH